MNDSTSPFGNQALTAIAVLVAFVAVVAFLRRRHGKEFSVFRALGLTLIVSVLGTLPLGTAFWWSSSNGDGRQNPYLLAAAFLPIGVLALWGIFAARKERMKVHSGLHATTSYRPDTRTILGALTAFFALGLPAIWYSGMGYMWLVEHVFNVNTDAKPQTIIGNLTTLAKVFPMIPVMVCAIYLAGIPWMYIMAHTLSWKDIQFFTNQKGRRLPLLSDFSERLWLHMIRRRSPSGPTDQQ